MIKHNPCPRFKNVGRTRFIYFPTSSWASFSWRTLGRPGRFMLDLGRLSIWRR